MRLRDSLLVFSTLVIAHALPAQVRQVGDLNTRQIRALDRARTVVILQGGMLEEHGPYLPAFTDGVLSARLTSELADGIVKRRPGWTVLVFPPVAAGASGSNEIGRQYSFAGTYALRPSTLRAAFVDLASELGEQGFRWVLLVHVHGSPLHIGALDDASDFFHDTYGGTMVNLWGLLPVLGGWGGAMTDMTVDEKRADGVSLHAGMDEHSLMLFLRPDLVAPDYRMAPVVSGGNIYLTARDGTVTVAKTGPKFEQVAVNKSLVRVDHPTRGSIEILNTPLKLSGSPGAVTRTAR